jgi:hypothetical protein
MNSSESHAAKSKAPKGWYTPITTPGVGVHQCTHTARIAVAWKPNPVGVEQGLAADRGLLLWFLKMEGWFAHLASALLSGRRSRSVSSTQSNRTTP